MEKETMKDRLKMLIYIEKISTRELEEKTGIDRYKWGNLLNGKNRLNEDHIEALKKIWPQFIYWLITGLTIPQAGQISPNMTENEKKQTGNEADEQQHDNCDSLHSSNPNSRLNRAHHQEKAIRDDKR